MAWMVRNRGGSLLIFNNKPKRGNSTWLTPFNWVTGVTQSAIQLPSDADEKLIGRHIDWNDEPVKIE